MRTSGAARAEGRRALAAVRAHTLRSADLLTMLLRSHTNMARGALFALALALTASARRVDTDFEFDDNARPINAQRDSTDSAADSGRLVYDPHNPLCAAVSCPRRQICAIRDGIDAVCADKRGVLHSGGAARPELDEDVFYEAGPGARCVGCGAAGGARPGFLCGSDNRTYSSLCRLDLHNCVRRARPPVRARCRGFCPCTAASRPPPRRRGRQRARSQPRRPPDSENDVMRVTESRPPHRAYSRRPDPAAKCELDKMADRLLDWFSVLMEQADARPPPPDGFPHDCKPEVRWMFTHLDTDDDGLLSSGELYALRHDGRERCLRPFVSSCGSGAGGVSRAAWCGCLSRAARPCLALSRAHPPAAGAYVPACDAHGYYRPRQCHPALGVCWCVTRHGVEVAGSRSHGAPPCPAQESPRDDEDADAEPDDAADADDADVGSGDSELGF